MPVSSRRPGGGIRRDPAPARLPQPRGAPTAHDRGGLHARDDRGSQALELALATPLLALGVVALLAVAQVGATILQLQQTVAVLARTAAIAGDDEVEQALRRAHAEAGRTTAAVDPPTGQRRPGDLLTVTLDHDIPLAWTEIPVQLRATAHTEDIP